MGDYDKFINTGNEILKEVSRAVDTGDYSKLGDTIRVQVTEAVNQAKAGTNQNFNGRASTYRSVTYASGRSFINKPFFAGRISKSAGIVKTIFGIMGAIVFGLSGFGLLLSALITLLAASFDAAIICGVLGIICTSIAVFSGVMAGRGSKKNKLAQFYHKYGKILGNSEYFSIRDLAYAANEDPDKLLARLKEMEKLNFFPFFKLDENETTVMVSMRAYDSYLKAENSRHEREMASASAAQKEQISRSAAPSESGVLAEGRAYLKTIHDINDQIPGDEMSDKLYKLEAIMKKIFTQVEKDPSCEEDLRKFMNYYLPTTTKLLNAYIDLDRQPEVGENIAQTKREIEDAMDVINEAFENLLDSLFQDLAWDISSDISVMKTMMAQDGLTESELSKAKEKVSSGQVVSMGGAQAMMAPDTEGENQGTVELKF